MLNNPDQQPLFSDVSLKQFKELNPHTEINIEEDCLIIEKPWGKSDCRLKSKLDDRLFFDTLNNLRFSPKFDALIHNDEDTIEFIYSYLDPKIEADNVDRAFTIHFKNNIFHCKFGEPTARLYKIASAFERLPTNDSERSVPQIPAFRDSQKLDELSSKAQNYFKNKVPRSFFVHAEVPISSVDLESLCRHLNFLMGYYDRFSALIEIYPELDADIKSVKPPIQYTEGHFPEVLMAHPIDDIVMRLIEVARTSSARFAILYYYQIFEYAGYYYVDDKAKKILRNFLKDPALINCGEEKVTELFSMFTDLNHNDDVKMRKVIEDHCEPRILWREIENDIEFYYSKHDFDGGFICKPLISKDTTEDAWCAMWMPNLFDHITKIRNSLVHARERRENRVILPTRKNNLILRQYLPLIRRMAEQIALRT